MGKALYREYRPKSLDDVIGQEHITDTLKNALKKSAISHAYLFTGPRGVGKTSVARILAHEINELEYDESKTHLDIIEIDAASNRRIDEIRDLRDKVHIAPTSSKYKVYIIDEVHMLTREAFNALLKTLEEPPEHVVFILATTEAHKVPETIISRTQRYTFKPISENSTIEHLRTIARKEKLNITDDALGLLAEHGRGSFRDSIGMLDQIAGFGHDTISKSDISNLLGVPDSDLLEQLIIATNQSDVQIIFELMQSLREQGAQPASIAKSLISLLRFQIAENKTNDFNMVIKLMKDLLPLTGLQGTYEGLEIALLDSTNTVSSTKHIASIEESSKEINQVTEKAVAKTDIETRVNDEPATKGNSVTKSEDKLIESDNDDWSLILNDLKKTHNTLYGLLRMANVEITEGKVSLVFNFEFHRKQLNQSKNIDKLKNIINEQLGAPHELLITVTKLHKKPLTRDEKPTHDTLSSVSNIFGGAELLES